MSKAGRENMTLEEAIAVCEANGIAAVRPRDNNQAVRDIWTQIGSLFRMAEDMVADGAVLVINHPAYFGENCDMIQLARTAMIARMDNVLKGAVVVKEQRDAA